MNVSIVQREHGSRWLIAMYGDRRYAMQCDESLTPAECEHVAAAVRECSGPPDGRECRVAIRNAMRRIWSKASVAESPRGSDATGEQIATEGKL